MVRVIDLFRHRVSALLQRRNEDVTRCCRSDDGIGRPDSCGTDAAQRLSGRPGTSTPGTVFAVLGPDQTEGKRRTMNTTPRRSIQYLLSVDRALRKISLRRLRTEPAVRPRRSHFTRKSTNTKRTSGRPATSLARAVTLAAICLAALVVIATSRRISHQTESDPPAAVAEMTHPPETISVASVGATGTTPVAAPGVRPRETAGTAGHVRSNPPKPAASAARPAAIAIEATPPERTAAGHDRADAGAWQTVTISGCVERDRDAFWLKDVSGDDVPRTRSWKSAFFKKRTSAVGLIDGTDHFGLDGYVGQRVVATGTLVNSDLHAVSLQQMVEPCPGR